MWIDDRHHQRGVTLIEVSLTIVLLAGLSLMAERALTTMRDASGTLTRMQQVQQRSGEVAYKVHREIASGRKIFYRGTEGNDYFFALDLGRFGPAEDIRLPLPNEFDPLGPDKEGVPRTSNVLFFARETDPFVCPADASAGKLRYLDVYRFVCVYPHEASPLHLVRNDEQDARDLILWRSTGFPSYRQLLEVAEEEERARIVRELYETHGFEYAWDSEVPVDQAFHALDASGAMAPTPAVAFLIPEDPEVSPGSLLLRHNFQLARTEAGDAMRRAVLTTDPPESWVPDGFEVKIVGSSSRRQIWFRITVEGQSGTAREVVAATALIATARDL